MKPTINIAEQFSKFPGLRYERLSEGVSGEKFRDEFLLPALEKHEVITVVFDGNVGEYLPSFLEECFGGLVRKMGFSENDFDCKVKLISIDDPTLIEDVKHYVKKVVGK
jgi:hypothetical protein